MTFYTNARVQVTLEKDQYLALFKFLHDGSNWIRLPEEKPDPPESVEDKVAWCRIHHRAAAEGELARILQEDRSGSVDKVTLGIQRTVSCKGGGSRVIPEEAMIRLLRLIGVLPKVS